MVQNAAACILTSSSKYDHISPVLASLQPVQVRADFKVLLLTYKIVNGLAPAYLTDVVDLYEPACSLRSQGTVLWS